MPFKVGDVVEAHNVHEGFVGWHVVRSVEADGMLRLIGLFDLEPYDYWEWREAEKEYRLERLIPNFAGMVKCPSR